MGPDAYKRLQDGGRGLQIEVDMSRKELARRLLGSIAVFLLTAGAFGVGYCWGEVTTRAGWSRQWRALWEELQAEKSRELARSTWRVHGREQGAIRLRCEQEEILFRFDGYRLVEKEDAWPARLGHNWLVIPTGVVLEQSRRIVVGTAKVGGKRVEEELVRMGLLQVE